MSWSVAASVLLLAAVVIGSFVVAQVLANNRAAEARAAAVSDLEASEGDATAPYSLMEAAIAEYDGAVLSARAAADSAAPAFAAVPGMTDDAALAAANAALAALVAQLGTTGLAEPPEPYERGEIDMTDIDEIVAATEVAEAHAERVTAATREAIAAQSALVEKVDALRVAQLALGSSLPPTAQVIVEQNSDADQSFRDAVTAAAGAVGQVQAAGASGDAELIAYAAAVNALRADQLRAENEPRTVTPPSNPDPTPQPEPIPAPAPAPVPPAPVPVPPAPQPTEPVPDPGITP